jgi:hypothetical protein
MRDQIDHDVRVLNRLIQNIGIRQHVTTSEFARRFCPEPKLQFLVVGIQHKGLEISALGQRKSEVAPNKPRPADKRYPLWR